MSSKSKVSFHQRDSPLRSRLLLSRGSNKARKKSGNSVLSLSKADGRRVQIWDSGSIQFERHSVILLCHYLWENTILGLGEICLMRGMERGDRAETKRI